MQEPQYGSPGVRELLDAVGRARIPCLSIMNMPPLPYLSRLPQVNANDHRDCYTDPSVWDNFDPALVTLCSPDPQAFRPPDQKVNVLQVGLPTNFKAARFASDSDTAMLRRLQADIDAARFDTGQGVIELPVKLKVHDSVFVPLAKWCMLLTGNYRCIRADSVVSIRDAVHEDLERSRSIYEWVAALCMTMGAAKDDLRKVRARGVEPGPAVVCRARGGQRCHRRRARRPLGAKRRGTQGHAFGCDRRHRRARRPSARRQPAGRVLKLHRFRTKVASSRYVC
jgi:hypothetical protein